MRLLCGQKIGELTAKGNLKQLGKPAAFLFGKSADVCAFGR